MAYCGAKVLKFHPSPSKPVLVKLVPQEGNALGKGIMDMTATLLTACDEVQYGISQTWSGD